MIYETSLLTLNRTRQNVFLLFFFFSSDIKNKLSQSACIGQSDLVKPVINQPVLIFLLLLSENWMSVNRDLVEAHTCSLKQEK